MKHRVPMYIQKIAVLRAYEILKQHYPMRIVQKKSTQEQMDKHLEALDGVMETLDALEKHKDVRENL